jgi:hypothetical protein
MCVHSVTSVVCKEGIHMGFKSISKLKNGRILKYRAFTDYRYITLVFDIPDPRINTPFSHQDTWAQNYRRDPGRSGYGG